VPTVTSGIGDALKKDISEPRLKNAQNDSFGQCASKLKTLGFAAFSRAEVGTMSGKLQAAGMRSAKVSKSPVRIVVAETLQLGNYAFWFLLLIFGVPLLFCWRCAPRSSRPANKTERARRERNSGRVWDFWLHQACR
jgi:hypothetical protein